jgi:glycosyltransferase involved in cell wall biosynthesis
VVGWVGRLSPEKGPDVFLDALALLKDTNVRACIVGDGPERARLESQAVLLGVSDRIKWTGSIPDAGRIFSAFDTFVLSSRTEGTPVVLIEAVNAGVAVIATRVGGIPDLLSEKEAFLVNPLAPAEIASAVRLVQSAADEALGRTVAAGERLQARNRHKSWVSDYDRVYRTLLDNRG